MATEIKEKIIERVKTILANKGVDFSSDVFNDDEENYLIDVVDSCVQAIGELRQPPPVEVEQGKCESCGKPKPSNAYLKCPDCYGDF